MVKDEFESALTLAYQLACKHYGEDYASSAVISTLQRGASSFNDEQHVRNYLMNSARGDRNSVLEDRKAHDEWNNEWRYMAKATVEPNSDLEIELSRLLVTMTPDMQAAVTAHLLGGSTITGAAELIDEPGVSFTTRRYRLQETVNGVLGWLRDYYDKY